MDLGIVVGILVFIGLICLAEQGLCSWKAERKRVKMIRGKMFYLVFKEVGYYHRWSVGCRLAFQAMVEDEIRIRGGDVTVCSAKDLPPLGDDDRLVEISTQSFVVNDMTCYNLAADVVVPGYPNFSLTRDFSIEKRVSRCFEAKDEYQAELLADSMLSRILFPQPATR